MPSKSSELSVAPGFYSFCNDRRVNNNSLTNSETSSSLASEVLLMTSASDDLQNLLSSEPLFFRRFIATQASFL